MNGMMSVLLNPVPMPGIGPVSALVLICTALVAAAVAVGAVFIIRSVRRKK